MLTALSDIRRYAGGLHVTRVRISPDVTMTGHRHDQPTMVAITSGSMLACDSEDWHAEREGSLHLLPSGVSRAISTSQVPADCLIITADRTQSVGRHQFWKRSVALHLEDVTEDEKWREVVAILNGVQESADKLEDALLRFLSALVDAQASRSSPDWLGVAIQELCNSPGATARSVARSVGVHPVHLARVVRSSLGITVRELLRRARVERAARLLGESNYSISRVAHEAAFSDHSHLCRELLRRVGMTPTEYRDANQSGNVASIQADSIPDVQLGSINPTSECDSCETVDRSSSVQPSLSHHVCS